MIQIFCITFCWLAALPCIFSQARGGMSGKVMDEGSGDEVPFAQIILMQEGAMVQATVSDWEGNYFIGNILPGDYELLARGQGFSPLKITDIPLNEGEWLIVPVAFAGESFDTDTLLQKYSPPAPIPKKNNKQTPKQSKNASTKKSAYQRRLERAARKLQ